MDILDRFFKQNPYFITKHHLDSYNDFVSSKLPNIIKTLNPITVIKKEKDMGISHEINIYIGDKDGTSIFLQPPMINENGDQYALLPNEARLKDMTYAAELKANILIEYKTIKDGENPLHEFVRFENIRIGSLPIMLHSKLCCLQNKSGPALQALGECIKDVGGYFIIDGKEKVIVAQERIATNRIFINKSKDDKYSYSGMVRCTSVENPLFPKTINLYVMRDELKRNEPDNMRNAIVVSLPGFKNHIIPLFVLFRALGVESDRDILEHIVYDVDASANKKLLDMLFFSVLAGKSIMTQEDALQFLANRVEYQSIEKVHHILLNDVFPNMSSSYSEKALFLGHVVNKLVRVAIGAEKESDRDNYLYKRVDISGFLLANLFRDYYNQFRNVIRNRIDNEYLYGPWKGRSKIKDLINKGNQLRIFDFTIITNGMLKSLKGNWGKSMVDEKSDHVKQGLVQDLSRISYMGYTSHLRRVNTPIDPTAKVVAPHRLHSTQWGIMCPCESPDGGGIGLLKNFAILCNITYDIPIDEIKKVLHEHDLQPLFISSMKRGVCKVMINSNWYGIHSEPAKLFKVLKDMKRSGKIDLYTSISWDVIRNEINVLTESGRCTRPLLVVEDGQLVYDPVKHASWAWSDLVKKGVIEYMDVEEIGHAYVAMHPNDVSRYHTHCEIHPSTIFSVVTHNIPLANHNQAPRNVFFGAQGKQAIGVYATNYNNRIDTMSYIMHYPQRAIVGTKYMDYIGNNELPGGANLIVAIASYSGFNQEDSIIINKSAIERGLFNLTYFKSIIEDTELNKKNNVESVFANPLKMVQDGVDLKNIKFAKYSTLDENGFPHLNQYIQEGDAIIGKTIVHKELISDNNDTTTLGGLFNNQVVREVYRDSSLIADKTVSGRIDKIIVYPNTENGKRCKIRLRKFRIPELGDKQSSRHGQKGVIGYIMPAEDMPFSHQSGVVPDIIINPHAFPSRMTIAHILECVLCKTAVHLGCYVDGTPFNNYDYSTFNSLLETRFGLEKQGNEILYNGLNGKQIETEIFIGPTYYMRLKHMVGDKINYRAAGGPITAQTRQPTKGRSNGGALRVGEMEVHCTWSHGLMHFLKESMMERSDKHELLIDNENKDIVNSLHDVKNISKVKVPYSLKLLLQEIIALGVKPEIITDSIYADDIPEEDVSFEDVADGNDFETQSENEDD